MKKYIKNNVVKILLATFFIVAVIFPLLSMLSHLGDVDIAAVVSAPQFRTAMLNSLIAAGLSTVCSVSLAFALAWSIARSNIRFKGVLSVLFTLPMLIPSISHGMGLVLLFGRNGVLTNFFGLQASIYGLGGIVLGSVMYSFPVAFLMLTDVLKYEDCSAYEAADVLGVPKCNQFLSITLPYLRKPFISVIFASFTLVVTDYGVPLMVGGKFMTLPVMMYQEVIGLLNFGKGSVIGLFLLIPAVIAFLFDIINSDKGSTSFITKPADIKPNSARNALCYLLCVLTCIFVIFPIIAFGLLTFVTKYPVDLSLTINNIFKAMDMKAGQYLINSLVIAVVVSVIGAALSYIVAYITARMHGKTSRFLHLISITSLAVPGIVLGLSYVLFFKGSFLYGTMTMLIMVNTVHFFASPYLLAYNSFCKINGNLEAVGATLGINRFYLIKDVFAPQMRSTILEMLSYFFVNCMITISAVSFLSTVSNQPIALMITQFEAQMLLECSAFVSLLILFFNMLVKGTVYLVKRKITIQEGM